MHIHSGLPWLVPVAGLTLAACAGGPVVSSHTIEQAYDSQQLGYVTQGGEQIPVIVGGDPFGPDRAALNRAVLGAMQGSNFGPAVEFAVDPARPARQNSRVVLAFNPKGTIDPGALCGGMPDGEAPAGGAVRISAAYCEGSFALTRANVRAANVDGPQSPAFRAMMVQLTQALFPPRNPHRDETNGTCSNC